jgi:hypothetical protein
MRTLQSWHLAILALIAILLFTGTPVEATTTCDCENVDLLRWSTDDPVQPGGKWQQHTLTLENNLKRTWHLHVPHAVAAERRRRLVTACHLSPADTTGCVLPDDLRVVVAGLSGARRFPLILAVHPYGGDAVSFGSSGVYEFAKANKHDVVVAAPQGVGTRAPSWNAVTCCGDAVKTGVDDFAFLKATREAALASLADVLDASLTYGVGWSNGGL